MDAQRTTQTPKERERGFYVSDDILVPCEFQYEREDGMWVVKVKNFSHILYVEIEPGLWRNRMTPII